MLFKLLPELHALLPLFKIHAFSNLHVLSNLHLSPPPFQAFSPSGAFRPLLIPSLMQSIQDFFLSPLMQSIQTVFQVIEAISC